MSPTSQEEAPVAEQRRAVASVDRQALLILVLLLVGVMCSSALIPYMGVYIVEGLGKQPWQISVYTVITILLTLVSNRQFGEWIDGGGKVAPLILASICAFALANIAIISVQRYWVLLAVGSVCFSISNAAVSTMYSYGRLYAENAGLNIERYNAYLRSMTSLGWMIAPALAFLVAGKFGYLAVFKGALAFSVVWLAVWYVAIPRDFSRAPKPDAASADEAGRKGVNRPLWYAAIACFFFALAHTLCSGALPLFYIQEAGLPTFAPGLSFSVKTFMEILAILAAPWMIQHIGARKALLAAAAIAVAAFYTLSQVASLPHMVFGSALEGLYYGIFAGVGITFMQGFADGRMARATALYMNSLFVGGLVSGSAMGFIAQAFDFKTAIQFASVGAVAAALVLLLTRGASRPLATN